MLEVQLIFNECTHCMPEVTAGDVFTISRTNFVAVSTKSIEIFNSDNLKDFLYEKF